MAARVDRRRQLRLGSLGDGQPLSGADSESRRSRPCSISGEEVWLDTQTHAPAPPPARPSSGCSPYGLKPRKKEKFPGEWASQLNGDAICSYPPEDLVIEDYGRFLKKKGKSMLSEERVRVRAVHHLDSGRHRHARDHPQLAREARSTCASSRRLAGEVGAVVVIFDEDRDDRYTYLTTWLGEHQNESDMAFYSTYPVRQHGGPGHRARRVRRLSDELPPRRMFDVWQDPDYEFAESKPERLLLAGLDYSIQRYVVYVAAKPPRSIFRTIAARLAGRSSTFRSASSRR